jgi:hypothetical protein
MQNKEVPQKGKECLISGTELRVYHFKLNNFLRQAGGSSFSLCPN